MINRSSSYQSKSYQLGDQVINPATTKVLQGMGSINYILTDRN
jgi:hypothetical protein